MARTTSPKPRSKNAADNVAGSDVALAVERELRAVLFAPPPRLTVSQWADRYRVLTSEASATIGQWTSLPFQREMMDVIHDPAIDRVVAMMPSQVSGKTEVLLNIVGYLVDLEPSPILGVQPSIEMCNDFSKDRLAPMFRHSPRLRGKLIESGRRETNNTLRHKAGPGWHVTLVGSNSPSGLSSRPIRVVLADEVDRYEASAKSEGDPVKLAEARTTTFLDNRITYLTSSPSIKGESRIEDEYGKSDRRKWYVPCPHCEHMQTLEWGGPNEPFGLKWTNDEQGHHPETAEYLCVSCGALIDESWKGWMNQRGEWRATGAKGHIAGFQMTCLASPLVMWQSVVQEFLDAKKTSEQLQVFINTRLAETWEAPGESLDSKVLADRRERWEHDLPHGVRLLTAAVDVQRDRLEVALWGWGDGEESWIIGNYRIMGDPSKADVWQELETWRTGRWHHPDGTDRTLKCMCVDSGDLTAVVYDYCRPRWKARVYATKGISQYGRPIITKPTRSDKYNVRLWTVGIDQAKDMLFARLNRIQRPGPGYIHVGIEVDNRFLEQFEAERAIRVTRGGRWVRTYRRIGSRSNEAIDLAVMNIAALHILGPVTRNSLQGQSDAAKPRRNQTEAEEMEPITPVERAKARMKGGRRRRGWVQGWRK